MTKPIIGITVESEYAPNEPRSSGKLWLNWNYFAAIADAGGQPIVIPPRADMAEIAELIDGWLIPGGADIDAARWGEDNHSAVELQDPSRFEAEVQLYAAAPDRLPIFGICYGCQFLNVVRGGSLVQHVPDVVGHEFHSGGTLQTYQIDPESRLAKIVGEVSGVGQSWHHQALGRLGTGVIAVAHEADGTIEAIEIDRPGWTMALQWHPERTLEDPAMRKIFAQFIAEAAAYRAERSADRK